MLMSVNPGCPLPMPPGCSAPFPEKNKMVAEAVVYTAAKTAAYWSAHVSAILGILLDPFQSP